MATNVQISQIHRTFVLLGGVAHGKSTLCNLLYGERVFSFAPYKFKVPTKKGPNSITKYKQSETSYISSNELFNVSNKSRYWYFKIIDMPCAGDKNFSMSETARNISSCFTDSNAYMNITFLIVVNLVSDQLNEYLPNLSTVLNSMKDEFYNLFDNAIVVLTHKDEYMRSRGIKDEDKIVEIFDRELELELPDWVELNKLLKLIPRKIFTNATDYRERRYVIYKAATMIVPTLDIIIHGSNSFPGQLFQQKLKEGAKHIHDFNLVIKLAQDYNSSATSSVEIVHDQSKAEEIRLMRQLVNGISVIVILINFDKHFTSGMDNFVNQLRRVYGLDAGNDWWDYIALVFLVSKEENWSTVDAIIKENLKLEAIVHQTGRRYMVLTDISSCKDIADTFLKLCFMVKRKNKGRDFIKSKVVDGIIDKNLCKAIAVQLQLLKDFRIVPCRNDPPNSLVFIPEMQTCESIKVPNSILTNKTEGLQVVRDVYKYLFNINKYDAHAEEIKSLYLDIAEDTYCKHFTM